MATSDTELEQFLPPPPPLWETPVEPLPPGDGAGPRFDIVRRGYDPAQVDRFLLELRAAPAPAPEPPDTRPIALDVGQILIDARMAAERVRSDAEVEAAQIVAQAEREAQTLIVGGREQADLELAARRAEIEREVSTVTSVVEQLRDDTESWKALLRPIAERMVAALDQWPRPLPTPVELASLLSEQGAGA